MTRHITGFYLVKFMTEILSSDEHHNHCTYSLSSLFPLSNRHEVSLGMTIHDTSRTSHSKTCLFARYFHALIPWLYPEIIVIWELKKIYEIILVLGALYDFNG